MRHEHAEQRHEHRSQQEQELLVAAHVNCQRAGRGRDGCSDDQRALRDAREEILGRDRRRVHVRERLVCLVDGQREQRERRRSAATGDRGQDQLRVLREPVQIEAAGQNEDRAEPELEEGREQVADPDAEECASPVA